MFGASKNAVAAIAGGAALVCAAVAYAAIPDSSGVIHGCYDKKGALRVVDPGTGACVKGENALDWSQQGPAGPQGPPGSTGATGAQGPQGPTGAQGPAGAAHGYAFKVTGVSVGSSATTVISGSVPAGTYMVWAQTWFQAFVFQTDPDALVSCAIDAPFSESATEVVLHKEPSSKTVVNEVGEAVLVGSIELSGTTNTVGLTCTATSYSVDARESNLDLIPLDAMN